MDETTPTARALRTLELLQNQPGITAAALGAELGVTDRAARRYVALLREGGIPIHSEPGRYGGYRLGRGLRLPPLTFSAAEALGVVMAVLDGHHAASDPTDLVGGALTKIMRALPEPVAAQAEAVRRATAAAPDRAAARPDPNIVTALVDGSSARRRIRLDYRSEAERTFTVEADPWAVVVRHGRWYLLCHSHTAGSTRTYRIDRIREVAILDENATIPADFDPIELLERHLGVGWEFAAEIEIDAPAEQARRVPRHLGHVEPLGAEHSRLTGTTGNPQWYAEQLAAHVPWPFRVRTGSEVRDAVAALGRRFSLAAAANSSSTPSAAPS